MPRRRRSSASRRRPSPGACTKSAASSPRPTTRHLETFFTTAQRISPGRTSQESGERFCPLFEREVFMGCQSPFPGRGSGRSSACVLRRDRTSRTTAASQQEPAAEKPMPTGRRRDRQPDPGRQSGGAEPVRHRNGRFTCRLRLRRRHGRAMMRQERGILAALLQGRRPRQVHTASPRMRSRSSAKRRSRPSRSTSTPPPIPSCARR